MVIEWLKYRVAAPAREKFIEQDALIWTSLLNQYPGFLGKEVWINPQVAEEVIFVIHWETRQQWKSIPQEVLAATEQKFAEAMNQAEYQMLESREYQVRKFAARNNQG